MLDEEKISKLPKWAQDEFRRIQCEFENLEKQNRLLKGQGTSRIYVRAFPGEGDRPIGDHETVSFDLDDGSAIDVSIRGEEPDRIYVSSRGSLRTLLDVRPRACNVVTIGCVE